MLSRAARDGLSNPVLTGTAAVGHKPPPDRVDVQALQLGSSVAGLPQGHSHSVSGPAAHRLRCSQHDVFQLQMALAWLLGSDRLWSEEKLVLDL